jgi:hypothetical protein
MKKFIFGLIATVMFGFVGNAQKSVKLVDIKGLEMAIIIDLQKNNSFSEFYLFQYNDLDFSKLITANNVTLVQASLDNIILKNDSEVLSFSILGKNNEFNKFIGYGISKRNGKFKLINYENPKEAMDLILSNNQVHRTAAITCHSGGVGSTECSATPSDLNVGAASCSVHCGTGYHSCCNDTVGECKCKPNPK